MALNIIKREDNRRYTCLWCDITRKTKNNQTELNTEQASGNYQFTQGMEKHIKENDRDAISQIQNMENSMDK